MPDLVVCSLEPWDNVWRRNQYLLDGLLRQDAGLRVLFVEPASDPLYLLRLGQRPRLGNGLSAVPSADGRLHRLELTKWLPRALGSTADRLLARGVIGAARQLRLQNPLLWINDPGWAHLMVSTGWPAIYDITDDWAEADRSPSEHEKIIANERLLMEYSRAVVVCSPELARTKGKARQVDLIQNGVDVAWYETPQGRPADLGDRRAVVYAGTLHEDRLDVELCCRIADRIRELAADLVFVGPNALSGGHTKQLEDAGARILGSRPYQQIPGYLQHADVLVVPHVVDDFTNSLDPIKLYEYQAVGRPIAATPVSGFREMADAPGVAVCAGVELPDAVAGLLMEPPRQIGPHALADWSIRVDAMSAVLRRVDRSRRSL